jgi:NAD+ synthase (glutamine-hydrolysing)
MKVALVQINSVIGDFEGNRNRMIEGIDKARRAGADIAVFPELSVCGYPPQDFLEFDDFIRRCADSVQDIARHCTDIAAVIGAPVANTGGPGKNLYNAACFLSEGLVTAVVHKALLPNYDIFDEYRYFEPGREFRCVEYKGKRLALTVCEDIWDIGADPMYTVSPPDELARLQPDLFINISASPFHYKQAESRRAVIQHWSRCLQLPFIYVNYAGAQTELIFDGRSAVTNATGDIVLELKAFEEDFAVLDTENMPGKKMLTSPDETESIYRALVTGIRDYFGKMKFQKAVLGLSGGIDSAVTAAIAVEALGADNVHGILMPSQYSSDHSVQDALHLARNLGMSSSEIPIAGIYSGFDQSLAEIFKDLPFGLAEENLQSRIRGTLLMAYSNKFNHILLNTSNKSENSVGYGTLYGDMNGGLSVLGDVYKMQVYALAHYINREREIIPLNSITKPPSAELRPDQKDSDSLPEYELLDPILYRYIEERKGPDDIISEGFDAALVQRILRMVNRVEFKRKQTPPILRVSSKAFGSGRRLPMVARYLE